MSDGYAYAYLFPHEVRFIDAALARLIPADELGPGAQEAAVACFIDRRLAGSWGTHGRQYRQGPWQDGTPQQGYQSRLTPQEIYRAGISEIDAHCRTRHGAEFHRLTSDQQVAILQELETDRIALNSVPASLFFALLWRNTVEGFFADPAHGGNRDKIGWKLIGFPGLPDSAYATQIGRYDTPYLVAPVSILDVQAQAVPVDAQGYPVHQPIADSP